MPAERPQGIGSLYVSYPQFASQNCGFSICQWKSPPPQNSRAFLGPAFQRRGGPLPLLFLFSAPALRPQCLCVESPISSSPKTKTAQSKLCRSPVSCYLIAVSCYPLPLKTPLPKNPWPTPPIPPQTPSPSALHARAKSASLQRFSHSCYSQPAIFARPATPVPQWPCILSG